MCIRLYLKDLIFLSSLYTRQTYILFLLALTLTLTQRNQADLQNPSNVDISLSSLARIVSFTGWVTSKPHPSILIGQNMP